MIYSKMKEIGELESVLEIIYNVGVSNNWIILRSSNSVFFYDRKTLQEVAHHVIPIDNTAGSKELVTIEDYCYTPVFSKFNPASPIPSDGDSKYAEINAYSKDGLMWKYHLEGWTIAYNAGGLFVVNGQLVVGVRKENRKSLIFLNPSTGKESGRINDLDVHKTSGHILSPTYNFFRKGKIGFKEFARECFTVVDCSEDEPIFNELVGPLVQAISTTNEYFFVYHIEEYTHSKLSQFNFSDVNHVEKYSLNLDFRAYRILANSKGNLIIFQDKADCSFHCFSTKANTIIWKWKSKYNVYPAHFVFDEEDNLIILDGNMRKDHNIIILDGNTGEELQNLQDFIGNVPDGFPFIVDDKLLLVKEGKLLVLSRLI